MEDNTQQELSGKEAYEARKADKAKGQKISKPGSSKKAIKIVLWIVVVVAVIAGLVYLASLGGPQGEDLSVSYEDLGRDHIPEDSERPKYNSTPPTSGPHYPGPAVPGFYDEELRDERVVHNLEHGEIWISYKSNLDPTVIAQLREFAGPKVIITPRDANDTDVALAAWTRLDTFDLDGDLDILRVEDFIKRWQNRGPEQVPSSAHYKE